MRVRSTALVLLLVLAGCGSSGTVVPGSDLGAPTITYLVDVPDGYRVVEASVGTAVSGSDGTSTSEAYLNVLAEHVETGQLALLIYQRVDRRATPVAIFRFRESGADESAGEGTDCSRC